MLSLSRLLSARLRLAAGAPPTPLAPASAAPLLHRSLQTTTALERARKATRERKRKIALANKKRKEERLRKNPAPLPRKVVEMLFREYGIVGGKPDPLRPDESDKFFPADDVYMEHLFCYPRYEFGRALHELRCHYHPSMLNRPDDVVFARVEMNMSGTKKDKYLDGFTKMVPVVHPFGIYAAVKKVCAFVPSEEEAEKAKAAGAEVAGGEELIKEIVKGRVELADLDHFVCHEDLFVQMRLVAGMLRDKTPKKLDGTVSDDVVKMVRTFRSGMAVEVKKPVPSLLVANEPDFGYCEVPLGYLSGEPSELRDNLEMLLTTLEENKPRREKGGWITRVTLLLEDGNKFAKFSIIHDLIHDEKLQEHLEGRDRERRAAQKLQLLKFYRPVSIQQDPKFAQKPFREPNKMKPPKIGKC